MNLTSSLFFLLNSLVNSTELSLNETRISAPSIELQLIDSFRVNSPENERFDLSGILVLTPKLKVAFNISGDYLLINDKSSWVYIGTLLTERHEIQTVRWLDLRKYYEQNAWDLEDIASDRGRLFVVNEPNGSLFEILPAMEFRKKKYFVRLHSWSSENNKFSLSNAFGIESLAIVRGEAWLGNEISPHAFFKLNLKTNRVKTAPLMANQQSLTAFRLKQGVFFLLDREGRCIWKTRNPEKSKGVCLSFRKTIESAEFHYPVFDGDGVEHAEWGTAEGLDFKGETFVVATDNNGRALTAHAREKRPTVMLFEMPERTMPLPKMPLPKMPPPKMQ